MNYWEEIVNQINKNNLKVDLEKIKLALYFAEECHEGQYRKYWRRLYYAPCGSY